MSTLEIHLSADDHGTGNSFRPLEAVSGRLRWLLDSRSEKSLELQLLWHTEGKGTRDAEIVATLQIDRPPIEGEREFRFKLPAGPYSFSGKLFSVVWELQATLEPSGDSESLMIVVSPTGHEVSLMPNDEPSTPAGAPVGSP